MQTATNFSFLNARLHGKRTRLFEGDRLLDLLHRRSLPELGQALTGEALVASPEALERRLVSDHVADLEEVARYLAGAEREFFRTLLERYRVENLKVIIRWRAAGEARGSPAALMVTLPDRLEVPFERLVKAPTVEELVRLLPGRRLRKAAGMGLDFYQRKGSTFFIEAGLDRLLFALLVEGHRRLGSSHRRATASILSRERDIYNVMFVLRSAAVYRLAMEEIRPFLAPGGGRVGDVLLERLHANPEPAAALEALPAALTGGPAGPQPETPHLGAVEQVLWNSLARAANHLFYNSPLDLGMAVAFFFLKRVELFNVIRVVEGMRYGLAPEEVRSRLMPARGG